MKLSLDFIVLTIFMIAALLISPFYWIYSLSKDVIKYRKREDLSITTFQSVILFLAFVIAAPFRVLLGYINILWNWDEKSTLKGAFKKILLWPN